jgi:ArsR family transcriptional regulator, arsenate/arsenite/antimonite-responsive transcriptional repressor
MSEVTRLLDPPVGVEPSLDEAVGLLVAAADPHRLALLRALTSGQKCVCDLQVQVPLPGNRLSYHLKVLREAGLIVGTRRGRWIDYALVDGALDRLRAAVPQLPEPGSGSASGCGSPASVGGCAR